MVSPAGIFLLIASVIKSTRFLSAILENSMMMQPINYSNIRFTYGPFFPYPMILIG
jgi:hypothetical protein